MSKCSVSLNEVLTKAQKDRLLAEAKQALLEEFRSELCTLVAVDARKWAKELVKEMEEPLKEILRERITKAVKTSYIQLEMRA